jgi:hypothetical protein
METGLMERVLTELVRFEIATSDSARAVAPERTREEAQKALQREPAATGMLPAPVTQVIAEPATAPPSVLASAPMIVDVVGTC